MARFWGWPPVPDSTVTPTVRAGELRMVMVRHSGMRDSARATHPSNPCWRRGGRPHS